MKTTNKKQLKTIIVETTHIPRNSFLEFGWGNGYVVIPKEHPMHGKNYDDIDVEVHGGLTFSEMADQNLISHFTRLTIEDLGSWVVGFDTAHWQDTLLSWPKERVQEEADRLLDQLSKF